MFFSEKIAALTNQIRDLEGKLAAANGNVSALEGEKATLEAEKERLSARVAELEGADTVTRADHEAAIAAKGQEIATIQGKLDAAEKNVDAKVRDKIASAGVPAITRDPKAVDNLSKESGSKAVTPRKRLAALFNEELAPK